MEGGDGGGEIGLMLTNAAYSIFAERVTTYKDRVTHWYRLVISELERFGT